MSKRYAAYTKLKLDYPSKRVLRLTFDRPETHNSVDAETHTQLANIWRDINDDPDINAIIVTGAGKAFSAGGDFELIVANAAHIKNVPGRKTDMNDAMWIAECGRRLSAH